MSRNATATREPPVRPTPSLTPDLPLVTATIRTPRFAAPAVETTTTAVREHVPSRKNLLFHGGLAGTAALGLIPWPVAAAVGIGTAIAQR